MNKRINKKIIRSNKLFKLNTVTPIKNNRKIVEYIMRISINA